MANIDQRTPNNEVKNFESSMVNYIILITISFV